MRWGRALALLTCLALVLVGVGDGAVLAQDDVGPGAAEDAAALRQELRAQRDGLRSELAALEDELAATASRLVELEAAIDDAEDEQADAVTDRAIAEDERERPLAVRRAIAIETYMNGDPNANSLINEVLQANSSMDGARDRALYTSVVDWASQTLDELDREIEQLSDRIAELEEDVIPGLEEELADLAASQSDQLSRRDGLISQIEELDRQITALSRAPLTGLPVEEPSLRPILIVKIDNVGPARPQVGINAADIVVEEKVEGGLSRFAAMFQSTGSDPVGPVRSARTSDVNIFGNLDAPLFAYSGSNRGVLAALVDSELVDVGATTEGGQYFRDNGRRAPHNLFTRTSSLWAARQGGIPTALFEYRDEDEPLPGSARPATGVDLTYGAASARFIWNGSGWARETDGRPHTDASGTQAAPANVVVRFTEYRPSVADSRSPEAVTVGSGELWVLTAGQVVVGRWEQDSIDAPTRWLDGSGDPIRLTPGRTWIVMPDPGRATLR
ncbi:DUF3048 domain-containing protein [Actinomarinicola tropica]|nr:DUF3048 domain-containing protein [Actinomarinicola tropica]